MYNIVISENKINEAKSKICMIIIKGPLFSGTGLLQNIMPCKRKHENVITLGFYWDLLSNTVPFFSHELPSAILFSLLSIDT